MPRFKKFLLTVCFLAVPAIGILFNQFSARTHASSGVATTAVLQAQSQTQTQAQTQSQEPAKKPDEPAEVPGDEPLQAESAPGPAKLGNDADFKARCHAPGVIRCIGFDARSEIAGHIMPDSTGAVLPEIDTSVAASGRGSLKFTVPAFSVANSSGQYWTDFTDDLSAQFDSLVNGDPKSKYDEFYIQWRQRFSPEMLKPFKGSNGWKQVIIGEGDHPGQTAWSCTNIDLVLENSGQLGMPRMYHSCGVKDDKYEELEIMEGYDGQGSGIFSPQNAAGNGKCRLYRGFAPKIPPCVGYRANQWMTFQVHVKVGTWYLDNSHKYHRDSTVQLWVADEGKPSVPVIDFSPEKKTGYDLVNTDLGKAKFGKIWLLPYQTNKDGDSPHDKAYTWYDELIISRERIPDPK
jgi:hypothetical protein